MVNNYCESKRFYPALIGFFFELVKRKYKLIKTNFFTITGRDRAGQDRLESRFSIGFKKKSCSRKGNTIEQHFTFYKQQNPSEKE